MVYATLRQPRSSMRLCWRRCQEPLVEGPGLRVLVLVLVLVLAGLGGASSSMVQHRAWLLEMGTAAAAPASQLNGIN